MISDPLTPAFAKAGAAPGTTAGVEFVFLSFKCFNASRQLRSACRLPPQPSLATALHAQPRTQKPHSHINGFLAVKQATPRPHQWGGPACRSPGVTRFKPFKRLNILLACLIPQPTGTPRPHQCLLMGVQACRLPALQPSKPLKPLKGLKPLKLYLKLCKSFSERPTAQAKATPRPQPSLLLGGPACRLPGVTRFKPFKRLNVLLACLIPQPTGTARPHQWLLMGVQACRLPALKPLKPLKGLKPLKLCKSFSERPTAQAKATPRPHPSLLGGPACRSPGVTRFKPFKGLNILLACLIPQPTGTPRPHQWLLMGVQACRLPALQPLKGLKP